jgi:hypothetical protein
MEHNANATAQKAYWLAQTELCMRIIATGSATVGAGAYSAKTMIIDMVGKWESFSGLDDQDGNDIVTGTFRSRYSNAASTAASTQFTKFLVVNEVATLP